MTVSGQLLHPRMGGCYMPVLLVMIASFLLNFSTAWPPDNLDKDVKGVSLIASTSVLKESKMSEILELDLRNGKFRVSKPCVTDWTTGTTLPFPVHVEALRNIDAIRDFLIQTVHDRAKGPTGLCESEKCMQTNTVNINCKSIRSLDNKKKQFSSSEKSANKTMSYPFIMEVEALELLEDGNVFPVVREVEEMYQDNAASRNREDDLGFMEDDMESSTDYSDSEDEPVPEDEFNGSYGSPEALRGYQWSHEGHHPYHEQPRNLLVNQSNEQRLEDFDNLMMLSNEDIRIAGLPTDEMVDEFILERTLFSNSTVDDQVVPNLKNGGLPST